MTQPKETPPRPGASAPHEPTDRLDGADADSPWPGLASFTERQSELFFGRQTEADELLRLVRREELTILHGQSGLGKTSLLQAGLFPRLRQRDFFPVLVRIDHAPSAPTPAEQVKLALARTISDDRLDARPPGADESPWEYLHARSVDFWSPRNRLLTPVLVLDQFEELFTIGRADDRSRRRGDAFVAELAQLVENVPPPDLADRLDSASADAIDLGRRGAKIILTLRSDFLADLESLAPLAHGLTRNRMRLLRMDGAQALQGVVGPGKDLVTPAVARQIVRFVAGDDAAVVANDAHSGGGDGRSSDAPIDRLEVEPALLSLFCRELDARRRRERAPAITADFLAGHRQGILAGFYEASARSVSPAARRFIEDQLLTRSGYRNNVAVEDALAAGAITRGEIDWLVQRRLLRTDDRMGPTRVELTHDVLAGPVRASRDARQARESAEAAAASDRAAIAALRAARRRLARYLAGAAAAIVLLALVAALAIHQKNEAVRLRKQAADSERRALDAGRLAGEQRTLAEAQRRIAVARQLSAQALNLAGSRLDLALLLDLEALKLGPGFEPRDALLSLLQIEPQPTAFLDRHGDIVRALAFSPDGKTLATAGDDGQIDLIDADTRQPIGAPLVHRARFWGMGLSFQPGTKLLASGADDGRVLLWDLSASPPAPRTLIPAGGDAVRALRFSSDGRRLAVAFDRSMDDPGKPAVELWDAARGFADPPEPLRLVADLDGQKGGAHALAFTRDGKLLAAGGRMGPIVLWDLSARPYRPVQLVGHANAVEALDFSQDDKLLASGSYDGTLRLWDVAGRRPSGGPAFPAQGPVWSVAFVRNDLLASGFEERSIFLWSAPRLAQAGPGWIAHDSSVSALAMSPTEPTLISAGGDGQTLEWDASRLGRPSSVAALAQEIACGKTPSGYRNWGHAAFACAGRRVVAGGMLEDRLYVIDAVAAPPEIIARLPAGQKGINCLAASPDARHAATGGGDGSVVLWDLTADPPTSAVLGRIAETACAGLAFSPDGATLAAAGADKSRPVLLWDVATRTPLPPPPSTDAAANCVAFGPEAGGLLAWGGDSGKLYLFDLRRRVYLPFATPPQIVSVLCVAFSPDGFLAYSGRTSARRVYLWDTAARKPIEPALDGVPADWVWSLAFSPDGRTLAAGSLGAVLWDVPLRRRLGNSFKADASLFSVSFNPAGTTLAGWDGGSIVNLFDVDPHSWIHRAKRIANREMTPQERAFYLGAP